jgi:L-2-hydroxyglutarate oxidase
MTTQQAFDAQWTGDVIVIGAGIIGLATARELLRRRTGTRLVVLDKEPEIARHQTGHNSGVIHAGIYYKPGTLKAKLCVAGASELIHYCQLKSIRYRLSGKLIVATEESELPRLMELERRATANGCVGVRLLDSTELREIEPHVRGIKALWSPNTGIVDFGHVAAAYAEDVRCFGGEIRTSHTVTGIERRPGETVVETNQGAFVAKAVIACAGIYSDRVARMSGAPATPTIAPFRGDYYVLAPARRDLIKTNIYPVPDPRFPFLGVHLTPRINGDVWLGPNAVLAFSREGYRFREVSVRDMAELWKERAFLTFARKHWRTGIDEMARDLIPSRFLASLKRYVPELTRADLLPGPSGVRAQALSAGGEMIDDFVIDRQPGILHVRNAPSPAATSSLQIGRYIVDALAEMDDRYATSVLVGSSLGRDE